MAGGYDKRFSGAPIRPSAASPGAAAVPGAERSLPGLDDEERLPWLDAADEAGDAGIDPARVWGFVLGGLALLVLITAGVWWFTHRDNGAAQLADGSLIAAPPGPIKEAPQNPGGKTFDGTGDSSFSVSQGHSPGITLADGERAENAVALVPGKADSTRDGGTQPGSDNAVPASANAAGGVGVQVGAFSTQQAAIAAWDHLAKSYDALAGTSHRIVEGKADIGAVYGLQAVAGSVQAATALCERLKTAGLNCQVKDGPGN